MKPGLQGVVTAEIRSLANFGNAVCNHPASLPGQQVEQRHTVRFDQIGRWYCAYRWGDDGLLFFQSTSTKGSELWVSDGTPGGTEIPRSF